MTESISAGDGKRVESVTSINGGDGVVDREGGLPDGQDDYDVQTVERVYRKLDMRIIPRKSLIQS